MPADVQPVAPCDEKLEISAFGDLEVVEEKKAEEDVVDDEDMTYEQKFKKYGGLPLHEKQSMVDWLAKLGEKARIKEEQEQI